MQVAELPRWIVKDDAEVRTFLLVFILVLISFEEIYQTLEKEFYHKFWLLEVLQIVCYMRCIFNSLHRVCRLDFRRSLMSVVRPAFVGGVRAPIPNSGSAGDRAYRVWEYDETLSLVFDLLQLNTTY